MKLLVGLLLIVGAYVYFLMYTTNIVMNQVSQLHSTYQYVADNSDKLATGR
jgi:hypothetical protein